MNVNIQKLIDALKVSKIDAIKQVRHETGEGLKEAKDLVEALVEACQRIGKPGDFFRSEYAVVNLGQSVTYDDKTVAMAEARYRAEQGDIVAVAKVVAKSRAKIELVEV